MLRSVCSVSVLPQGVHRRISSYQLGQCKFRKQALVLCFWAWLQEENRIFPVLVKCPSSDSLSEDRSFVNWSISILSKGLCRLAYCYEGTGFAASIAR